MEVTDAFMMEVLNATSDLPPEDMEKLTQFLSNLIQEHMAMALAEAKTVAEVRESVANVAEVIAANAFLAGRAHTIHGSEDRIPIYMDRETIEEFIEWLTHR